MTKVAEESVPLKVLFEWFDFHDNQWARAAQFGWIMSQLEQCVRNVDFGIWVLATQKDLIDSLISLYDPDGYLKVEWGPVHRRGSYPVDYRWLKVDGKIS